MTAEKITWTSKGEDELTIARVRIKDLEELKGLIEDLFILESGNPKDWNISGIKAKIRNQIIKLNS